MPSQNIPPASGPMARMGKRIILPLVWTLRTPRAYELADEETAKHHNAPIFQGGWRLSYAALASEGEELRSHVLPKHRRISRPVPMLRYEYDVVVVGSGYGGAVAASRMARAGKSVCVLELGKERWPGEFPSGFASAAPEIHITGDIAHTEISHFDGGDRQGLYHLVLGKGQNVFVGNGRFAINPLLTVRTGWHFSAQCKCISSGRPSHLGLGRISSRNQNKSGMSR